MSLDDKVKKFDDLFKRHVDSLRNMKDDPNSFDKKYKDLFEAAYSEARCSYIIFRQIVFDDINPDVKE